jgi:hypothetical protein
MALQKADPEVLADLYGDDGAGYGRLFIVFDGGIVMKENVFWCVFGMVFGCVLMLIVSYPIIFDRGHVQGVRDSYNTKNGLTIGAGFVRAGFKPAPTVIAGAGDDGFRKVYEGE